MYDNRDTLNRDGGNLSITPGMNVYDANGDKVGSVQEFNPQANMMVVEKGFIFTKDLYIPTRAISNSSGNDLYLNVTKDDLKNDRYTTAPEGYTAGYASGTTTSRSDVVERGDQLTGTRGQTTGDKDIDVPVREEQLTVDKQRGQMGEAHIHKDTVEQQQSLNVPVTHEEVEIERRPVNKELTPDEVNAQSWQDKDIVMPVMGEEVVAEKRPVVKEELHIHKEPVTETEQVSDTVRKEQVRVEGLDDQGNTIDRNANSDLDRNP